MTAPGPLNTMQIGELEVLSLFDGKVSVPATGAYQAGPGGMKGGNEADWAPHQDLLDGGMVEFVFGGFLVRGAGDRVIVVDGGIGAAADPQYGIGGGQLLFSLESVGVDPGDVTDVLFTHLHFDHIGWASTDGSPTFPNATYRCDRRDWDHFVGTDDFATARLRPVEDRFEAWDGDAPIAPGVDVRLCAGHTPGARSSCCRRATSARSCWATSSTAPSSCSTTSGPELPTWIPRWRSGRATRSRASSRVPTCPSPRRTSRA